MFEFAIIPLYFLLSMVAAFEYTDTRVPCTPHGTATEEDLNAIIVRCYLPGKFLGNYVQAAINDSQKICSFLDPAKPLSMYMHGWGYHDNPSNNKTRNAILGAIQGADKHNNCEVIWDPISGTLDYFEAANNVCATGTKVGNLLNYCVEHGWDPTKIVLTGHSLGGHGVGHAARATIYKIKTVYGLDVAGPEWIDPNECLNEYCADHVCKIHSNDDVLGKREPLGGVNFYANGGRKQPMCGVGSLIGCDHEGANMYLSESILAPTPYIACPYDPYGLSTNVQCDPNQMVTMSWPNCSATPPGNYYFRTAATSIFALGIAGATDPKPEAPSILTAAVASVLPSFG